ncbi:aldolase [Sphingomonas sp.]|uniref:HPr kinase/phosphorylase n=1 Tax=Sphingomonas sp. TaxID=28214 RepID=UPI002C00121A|nr:aldolase [Sphingomonas sp.]HTG37702.1 aldolase [Sphingomonas sp.]
MTPLSSELCHASCVAIRGHAVLIEGPSGAGKSDLALRLIDRGAMLVSDDQTLLRRRDGDTLRASAPATIRGLIEVRGLGILDMAHADDVPVAMIVTIISSPERMPPESRNRTIAGVVIPGIALAALESSAPVKVELALARAIGDRQRA